MKTTIRLLGATVLAAALCSPVLAAPAASMPSMSRVGQPVELNGSGLPPGAMLTVRLTAADGQVSLAAVAVAADGTVRHTVMPATPGKLRVELIDAGGKVLAQSDTGVSR